MPESKTAERAKRERRPAEGRAGGGSLAERADRHPNGYRRGLRAVLPLLPAVAAFGISFGVLAQAAGMGAEASIVMSLTTFAGSAQFAVVSVLGAGGTAAAAIGAAVLLNARYAPMALAASSAFRGGRLRRLLEAQLLVDESWALSRREGGFDRRVLIGAGAALYVGWSGGTAVGVVAGDSLADPATLGLDAAFPALFLALVAPLLRNRDALAAALLGAGIAICLTPITPAGIPVIAATAACLVGLRRPAAAPAPSYEERPPAVSPTDATARDTRSAASDERPAIARRSGSDAPAASGERSPTATEEASR
ncbi:MAG TPA: AzlC family ABC transporter permease [Thermoleophilaceae bacterium]|nr:AzlC family ABC transporter permease [Thermoleophilaceae bacterium]